MGRFYRTTRPPQLNYAYKLPYSLAANTIQNIDTGVRQDLQTLSNLQMHMDSMLGSTANGKSSSKSGSTFGGQVIPANQSYYNKRMQELDDKINEVTQKIKEDPVNHKKYFGDILNLRKSINHELTVGPIAQMRNQYAMIQKNMQEDIKRNKKTPASYIRNLYALQMMKTKGYQEGVGVGEFQNPDVTYVDPHELAMKLGKDMRFNNAVSSGQYIYRLSDAMAKDPGIATTLGNMALMQGKTLPELLKMKKKNPTPKELQSAIRDNLKPAATAAAEVYWRDNASAAKNSNKQPDINGIIPGTTTGGTVDINKTPDTKDVYDNIDIKDVPNFRIVRSVTTPNISIKQIDDNSTNRLVSTGKSYSPYTKEPIGFSNFHTGEIGKLSSKYNNLPSEIKDKLAASFTADVANEKSIRDISTIVKTIKDPTIKNKVVTALNSPQVVIKADDTHVSTNAKSKSATTQVTNNFTNIAKNKLTAGSNAIMYYTDDKGVMHISKVRNLVDNGILAPRAKAHTLGSISTDIGTTLDSEPGSGYISVAQPTPNKSGGATGVIEDKNGVFYNKNYKGMSDSEIKEKLSTQSGYKITKVEKVGKGYKYTYEVPAGQITGKGFTINGKAHGATIYGLGRPQHGLQFNITANDQKTYTATIVDHDIENTFKGKGSLNSAVINLMTNLNNTYGILGRNNIGNGGITVKKGSDYEITAKPNSNAENGYEIVVKDKNEEQTFIRTDNIEQVLRKYLKYDNK